MRRLGFALGVVVVMAAIVALMTGTALAQAQSETISERTPFTILVDRSCTGEPVLLEGTHHLVFHTTEDPNGGLHVAAHNNIEAQGVGATSGDKYVLLMRSSGAAQFRSSESLVNDTLTQSSMLIRQGSDTPEDDLMAHFVFHITINANGEVTSEVVKAEAECK